MEVEGELTEDVMEEAEMGSDHDHTTEVIQLAVAVGTVNNCAKTDGEAHTVSATAGNENKRKIDEISDSAQENANAAKRHCFGMDWDFDDEEIESLEFIRDGERF